MTQPHPIRAATIVVVDDHPATLAAATTFLGFSFPRCMLLAAETAEQALELCASWAPEIVVMDVALPGMNGIDATRCITASFPGTRVVIFSSYDTRIHRDESAAAGASAFVMKSKATAELAAVVSSLLPPAAALPAD